MITLKEALDKLAQGHELDNECKRLIIEKFQQELGQEPCEDCVSLDDVINAISNHHFDKDKNNFDLLIHNLCKEIKELPSVQPTRIKAKWIPVSERLPDTDDEVLCWYEYYHWSKGKVLPEYGIGCYLKERKAWIGEVANGKDVRVIAWHPLPKAYDPQKSGDKE